MKPAEILDEDDFDGYEDDEFEDEDSPTLRMRK